MSRVCSFQSCVAGTGRSPSAYLTPRGVCDARLPSGRPGASPAGRQPTAHRCPPHCGVAAPPAARAARARGVAVGHPIRRPTWAAQARVPDRRHQVPPSGGLGGLAETALLAEPLSWSPNRVRAFCRHIQLRNRSRPSAQPKGQATPSCCPACQRVSTVRPQARAANPSTAPAPPAPARGAAVAAEVRAAGRAGAPVAVAAKRIGTQAPVARPVEGATMAPQLRH